MKLQLKNVQKSKYEGSVKAIADLVLDDAITIKGVRLVDSVKGPFVGMPSRKNEKTGEWHDIAWVEDEGMREELSKMAKAEMDGLDIMDAAAEPSKSGPPPAEDDVPF